MILSVGGHYINKSNGNLYIVVAISHIKLDNRWHSDSAITYKDSHGVTYTRMRDDFNSRFEYARHQDESQS